MGILLPHKSIDPRIYYKQSFGQGHPAKSILTVSLVYKCPRSKEDRLGHLTIHLPPSRVSEGVEGGISVVKKVNGSDSFLKSALYTITFTSGGPIIEDALLILTLDKRTRVPVALPLTCIAGPC